MAVPNSLDEREQTVCTDRGYGWEVVGAHAAKTGLWFNVRNLVTTDTGWLASWYTEPIEIKGVTTTAAEPPIEIKNFTITETPAPGPPRATIENQLKAERLANETARIQNETARIEREAARENRAANRENAEWMRFAYIAALLAALMTAVAYGFAVKHERLKKSHLEALSKTTLAAEIQTPVIAFPPEEWRAAREARRERRRNQTVYHGMSSAGPWSIPTDKVDAHDH